MKITCQALIAASVLILNGYSFAADINPQPAPAPHKRVTIGIISPAKHFEVRSNNEYGHIEECRVLGTSVTCHGKLEKLPPETISYQSIASGKISGNIVKTSSTSVTKLEDKQGKCSANIYSSWTESIALKSDHVATIKAGKVSSRTNKFGPPGCAQVSYSSAPPITIAGTWRELE